MGPLVEAFARYGGTRKAFCAEHGIAVHVLDYWRRRLAEAPLPGGGFIELEAPGPAPAPGIEVHYPSGVKVLLPAGTPAAFLRGLIDPGR
jgi:hypothetical protein